MTQDLSKPSWHKIWHLGDDIDTDSLAPGAWMQHGVEVIAQHCLENTLPHFARDVRPGDVMVAGRNFGIGSSREQAASVLLHLGVATVIAPSFGGLFFRNAFNLGLVLLTCPDAKSLQKEEQTLIDWRGLQLVLPSKKVIQCEPVPDFLLRMAQAGGLVADLKLRLQNSMPAIPNAN